VKMVESAVRSYVAEVLDPNTENPTLFGAGLPGGGYVDVDTAPHDRQEASPFMIGRCYADSHP
jgi:hypothetical protein